MSRYNILRPTQEMLLLMLVSYCIRMLKNNIISLGTTCYQCDNTQLCQQVHGSDWTDLHTSRKAIKMIVN